MANSPGDSGQRLHDPALVAEALADTRDAAEIYRHASNSDALPIAEQRIGEIEAMLATMSG